jgi:phenylacetic acid degradation operon negative regulatory protein
LNVDVTPKSLILDLLSTLPAGGEYSMPVRALVEAGGCFGMAASSIRVALARSLAQEQVARDERGRYRLGEAAGAVSRAIRNWRRLDEQTAEWAGGWIGVHRCRSRGEAGPARLRRDRSLGSLGFLGFREFEPGFFLRPDNLAGGVGAIQVRLGDLGLDPQAPVFEVRGFDALAKARARALWDAKALSRAYGDAVETLAESRLRLEEAPVGEAMVETFKLGGRIIRQLVLDPLLPDGIAPTAGRRALVAQMLEYDGFGRGCWAEFLRRHGVLHRRTPADLRVVEGAEQLRSVALAPPGARA